MSSISARGVRIILGLILFLSLSSPVHAQVVSTPTPTPTVLVPTATPIPAVVEAPIVIAETPTPTLAPTGPAETFALLGIGSIALVLIGTAVFFLF